MGAINGRPTTRNLRPHEHVRLARGQVARLLVVVHKCATGIVRPQASRQFVQRDQGQALEILQFGGSIAGMYISGRK